MSSEWFGIFCRPNPSRHTKTTRTRGRHMATTSVYYPQVNFDFDNNPDPTVRRDVNIKNARRVLMPARMWGIPLAPPKYNDYGRCCVTGIQLTGLGPDAYNKPLIDPDTLSPLEDGRTLYSEFFADGASPGQAKAFVALSSVDSGYPLRSSYCPELLQLYWLFSQWKLQKEEENMNERSSFLWKRKKIKMIPQQIDTTEKPTPSIVKEFEPFFALALKYEGKGVGISQFMNTVSGEVDLTTITLDLREFRRQESANGLIDATPSEAR